MQDVKTQSFINGEWVGSANQIDVLNPATGKLLASVANASIADCLLAVDAADKHLFRGVQLHRACVRKSCAKPSRS